MLNLSSSIAYALDAGLAQTSYEPLPQPSAHWLTLRAVESDGCITSVNCLASTNRVAGHVLYVPAEDVDAVVCLKTWL
jgi:hypothetical protein